MLDVLVSDAICTLTLNRPECRNAFNAALIAELTTAFIEAGNRHDVRIVRLRGSGKAFSAGADLDWMREMAKAGHDANVRDAEKLGQLFAAINTCPKPVVCEAHGAVMGGGVGLIAASDIVVAETETKFALSEVKLGLIPAVISPYVIAKMGQSQARRYFLTAETFTAAQAQTMGLVHEVVPGETQKKADAIVETLLANGPRAMAGAKTLIREVCGVISEPLLKYTYTAIATHRASEEGQEGMLAFLEKRRPKWIVTN